MKEQAGADIHTAAHEGLHARAGGYTLEEAAASGEPTLEKASKKNYGSWRGIYTESGCLAGTDHAEEPHWSSLFLKQCVSCEGCMLKQFMKKFGQWEGPALEKLKTDCLTWEGPHAGAGEQCEEEETTEMKHYEMITTPILHPSCVV